MARSGKQREAQLRRLHEGFWGGEDSPPAQVPDTFEAKATYEQSRLSSQFLEAVFDRMASRGIDQQTLAAELGVTEGRVSQILSGDQNLTLRTLASLAAALDAHIVVGLHPAGGDGQDRSKPPETDPNSEVVLVDLRDASNRPAFAGR